MSGAPTVNRLSQETINRIAAGEVVQKPAAAIKELLENSLDAGATSISVTVKNGGLQMIQIQDNGHGIRKEDLQIVCERFTTSKLTKFEDLETVATFGFRGEALASITYVSHVNILTKTSDSPCAYRAKYLDGKLVGEISPCAGNTGTIVTAEDMFYNLPTRKQAFKSPSEQYQKIIDVITKYSIHYGSRNISFTCKKAGQNQSDVHTPNHSTVLENIRIHYGVQLSRELLDFFVAAREEGGKICTYTENQNSAGISSAFGTLCFQVRGYISNANYSSKKGTFIFFINDRLVECASVRRTVETVYGSILPRHSHPFVYLSFTMPAVHIDVNVHPTKKEVHFMFETEILECLHGALRERLENANESRVFYTQSLLLPLSSSSSSSSSLSSESLPSSSNHEAPNNSNLQVVKLQPVVARTGGNDGKRPLSLSSTAAPNKLVRTDSQIQRIDAFFRPSPTESTLAAESDQGSSIVCEKEASSIEERDAADALTQVGAFARRCKCCPPLGLVSCSSEQSSALPTTSSQKMPSIAPSSAPPISRQWAELSTTQCTYDSVNKLIEDIRTSRHAGLEQMLRRHTFIGAIDATYCLIQVLLYAI